MKAWQTPGNHHFLNSTKFCSFSGFHVIKGRFSLDHGVMKDEINCVGLDMITEKIET